MAKFVLSAFADEAGDSLEEQILALKENEIDYIEPRNINNKGILFLTEDELRETANTLKKNGIKVGSLGSPIGKYPIDEPFDIHLAKFEKALRACEILETKNMRMFSFFVDQADLEKHRDEVLKRMRTLVEMAKERGIDLCHENESKIYGQMPNEVNDLLTEIKGLYGIFDAANYRMNNADIVAGIDATLINFKYMHIKDAIYSTQQIVPAGEGEGMIGDVIDKINAHTDDFVYLTLEPHLHVFTAYSSIDSHELKGKYSFASRREAFDFAANALKKLLIERGYRKDENNQWIK